MDGLVLNVPSECVICDMAYEFAICTCSLLSSSHPLSAAHVVCLCFPCFHLLGSFSTPAFPLMNQILCNCSPYCTDVEAPFHCHYCVDSSGIERCLFPLGKMSPLLSCLSRLSCLLCLSCQPSLACPHAQPLNLLQIIPSPPPPPGAAPPPDVLLLQQQ